jgi:hypothetical protein
MKNHTLTDLVTGILIAVSPFIFAVAMVWIARGLG